MDKYENLMREIVDFLDGTMVSKARSGMPDFGPIRGCSPETIQRVEEEIGKKLPLAMKAWYLAAGEVPPYVYDHDLDYSIRDLLKSQETAARLTQDEECQWELSEAIIPFAQRSGEQFLFVDISKENPEDPPVYHYYEFTAYPSQAAATFSAFMRDRWLR